MRQHAPYSFHDSSIHPLYKPIQLRGLGYSILEFYALGLAIFFELASVLAIIVGSDRLQLPTRVPLSSGLELFEVQQYFVLRL